MKVRPVLAALVVATALVPATPAVGADPVSAQMFEYDYAPDPLKVEVGQTVVWTNTGDEAHTVTAVDDSFDSGFVTPGGTFEFTFTKAGTVDYYCTLHGRSVMSGQLQVAEATAVARARDIADACDGSAEDGFTDVPASNPHETAIDCLVSRWKVASGTGERTYAPAGTVNRAQMATFLANLIERSGGSLPEASRDHFADDDDSIHERNINRLAEAGVVGGRTATSYDPAGSVTRAHMASFLANAYRYRTGTALPAGPDYFRDDEGSVHEANINAIAEAGFAAGVTATDYAPARSVQRDHMASFLARVLDKLVEDGHATVPR